MNKIALNENNDNTFMKIVKGILMSFLITLLCIFIFSVILTYSNVSESVIPIVIIIITLISIFTSTIICIKKVQKNGLINGAIIGGTYVILLYLLSSMLNTGFGVNIYSLLMIILGIISGIIGRNSWNQYKMSEYV